ncbi:MAG TPA: ScbR family autoregulator-binding transcription factor [Actinocrinis sp.]|jgi:AcrR family transcriptional regulator|uniref:ScbR family autoregulator-binding transcription factor n=1 Tax=Actinocrinis sp. TaxID=1920516 RepID=UPI002DDD32CE|nr:ScbR family autoregulator-binding transcription factor [Actinocrinis sp.]HEV3172558.1 ScbR family autoregulator-binding transcription factor [Actinocrinis sp.]
MPQQERAQRTRDTVLRAAGEAFAEKGFLGTSMADIFARAGVTKGALYFHFSSKEELAFAVISAGEELGNVVVQEVLASDAPPLQKLIDISIRWASYIQTDPIVRANVRLIVEQGTYSRDVPNSYDPWEQVASLLLKDAQERGELERSVDVKALAEFIVAAFTGAQIVSYATSGYKDLVRRVENMWQLLLVGLVPQGNPIIFFSRPYR